MTATNEKIDALEFITTVTYPCLFYAGHSAPAGTTVALLDGNDYEQFVELFDLEGTVRIDGVWNWDGEGDPRTFGGIVWKVQVFSDENTWKKQDAEANAYAGVRHAENEEGE